MTNPIGCDIHERNLRSGIYKITNIATGDYYIGSSCNIRRRLNEHRQDLVNNKHVNRHLQRAWNKYGVDNFEFTSLLLCEVKHTLYFEQGLLDLLKPVYNIATNAKSPMQGRFVSDETRRKLSEVQIGKHLSDEHKRKLTEARKTRLPVSDETRAKMSEAHKGEGNYLFGKHLTIETRRKLSEVRKGKRHSAETRAKMSTSQKLRFANVSEVM